MVRKIIFGGLLGSAVLALLLGGVYLVFRAWFNPSPPANDLPKPANALEAQRQDLDQFKRLVALDQSYPPTDRLKADRAIDDLRSAKVVLSWGTLRVRLMRIAAMADNGHTSVFSSEGQRPNAVPLRVAGFSDGLFVLRAKAADADLLGAMVEKIDGRPVAEVLSKLDTLRGGLPAWRRASSDIWVQSPQILNGLAIAPKPDLTVWTFRRADGSFVERPLKGEPLAKTESFEEQTRWLSPEPLDKEPKVWKPLLPLSTALPLPLRDFNRTFRREWINGSCLLFLQMKAIVDGPNQKISDWLHETQDAMSARKPCAVIMDLRYNTGGDYTNTWSFTHKLPGLVQDRARIYILTGPQTFSATITTTAFIKETLGERAVILGEPVGDRLKFLSEGNSGCVPNSGICLHYSTGMHNYGAPCTDWRVCYWINWLYPVRVKSLQPDQIITMRFADYIAHGDPVFDHAVVLANQVAGHGA